MSNIKFYTEEQVRNAIELAQKCEHECGGVYFDYTETEIIENLTPIELPSDEEIDRESEVLYPINKGGSMWMPSRYDIDKANRQEGFRDGAKWLKEQILNQNK
jgi:hypothetical protein